MRKSLSNRIKITKKGKVLRRTMGQCHFRAKKRTKQIKRKKIGRGLNAGKKIIKKYL